MRIFVVELAAPPALADAGEDAVYYGTRFRGASNRKATKILGFRPRRLEWMNPTSS
jgi:hypothetical protein